MLLWVSPVSHIRDGTPMGRTSASPVSDSPTSASYYLFPHSCQPHPPLGVIPAYQRLYPDSPSLRRVHRKCTRPDKIGQETAQQVAPRRSSVRPTTPYFVSPHWFWPEQHGHEKRIGVSKPQTIVSRSQGCQVLSPIPSNSPAISEAPTGFPGNGIPSQGTHRVCRSSSPSQVSARVSPGPSLGGRGV